MHNKANYSCFIFPSISDARRVFYWRAQELLAQVLMHLFSPKWLWEMKPKSFRRSRSTLKFAFPLGVSLSVPTDVRCLMFLVGMLRTQVLQKLPIDCMFLAEIDGVKFYRSVIQKCQWVNERMKFGSSLHVPSQNSQTYPNYGPLKRRHINFSNSKHISLKFDIFL